MQQLSDEVDIDEGLKLLLFYADWSFPSLDALERVRVLNQPEVVAVDVDKHPLVAHRFDIRACPTMILVNEGEERRRKIGWDPEKSISGVLGEV